MNKTTISLGSVVVLTASLSCALAGTEDATCKLVFDAMGKSVTTPNHSVVKLTLPTVNSGKPTETEFINTGKARYRKQDDGTWVRAMSPQDELDLTADNRKDNLYTCRFIRDETIDGAAASLYEILADTGLATRTCISKPNGLPVHILIEGGLMHSEERVVYGPVHVPPCN